jgi:hypothetical protein
MSVTQDPAGSPLFVEYRPDTRRRIAAAVDVLVALLDEIDGDADIEEDNPPEDDAPCDDVGDSEPALGATVATDQRVSWAIGGEDFERDEAEMSGCGDMDGVMEQHGFGVEYAG